VSKKDIGAHKILQRIFLKNLLAVLSPTNAIRNDRADMITTKIAVMMAYTWMNHTGRTAFSPEVP
jgi:hypothetical protein